MTKQHFIRVSPIFAATLLAAIQALSPLVFGQVRVIEQGGFSDAEVSISNGFGNSGENFFDDQRVPLSSQPSGDFGVTAQMTGQTSRATATSKTTLEGSYLFVDVNSPSLSGIKVNHSTTNTPEIDLPDLFVAAAGNSLYEATLSFGQSTPYSITGMVSGGDFRLPNSLGAFGPVQANLPSAGGGSFSFVGSVPAGTYEIRSQLESIANDTLSYEISFGEPETLITWNAASGNWGESTNWDPQVVPGSNATAVLNMPETYTVTVGGQTVERLELGGGVSANATLQNMDLIATGSSLANPGVTADGGTFALSGKLNNTHAVIGESQRTQVSVTGGSTRWENQGRLTVGDGGEATLAVTNSGEVIAQELRVGGSAFGVVNVEKDGQILAVTAAVGHNGNGTLNITDGGFVGIDRSISTSPDIPFSGSELAIGTGRHTGTVRVSGVNADSGERSTLNVTGGIVLYGSEDDDRGVANVTIDDGGLLEHEGVSLSKLDGESSLTVTSINADGTRSTYRGNETSEIIGGVGTFGNGKIEVLDGGLLQDRGLALESSATSRISGVSGTTASTMDILKSVQIGQEGTPAKLEVSNGGQLRMGEGVGAQLTVAESAVLAVGANYADIRGFRGELEISGVHAASGIASTVELVADEVLSGRVFVGSEGSKGTLNILDGGRLVGATSLQIDDGTVEVKGFDSATDQRSTLLMNTQGLDFTSVSNGSTLRISDGAQATLDLLDVGEGGIVGATGFGLAGAIGTGNGNASTLEILGDDFLNFGAHVGEDSSLIAADGGHVKVANHLRVNGQAATASGAITLGDIDPEIGKLRIGVGGQLSGSGTIVGDLANDGGVENFAGQVRAGNSPGTLTIDGNFTQGELGTTFLEIGGLIAGEEYDQLIVTGDMTFDGNLSIDFIDGFAPSEGDVFQFFDVAGSTSVIGTIPVEVSGLEDGFEFQFGAFDQGGVSLIALNDGVFAGSGMGGGNDDDPLDPNAVPEPSSLVVWLMLGLCVAGGRRIGRSTHPACER